MGKFPYKVHGHWEKGFIVDYDKAVSDFYRFVGDVRPQPSLSPYDVYAVTLSGGYEWFLSFDADGWIITTGYASIMKKDYPDIYELYNITHLNVQKIEGFLLK